MPKELADAIRHAYEELGKKVNEENPFVAVRSSATAEDLPDARLCRPTRYIFKCTWC